MVFSKNGDFDVHLFDVSKYSRKEISIVVKSYF